MKNIKKILALTLSIMLILFSMPIVNAAQGVISVFTDPGTGITVTGHVFADSMKVEKIYNTPIEGEKQAYEISLEGTRGDILGVLEFQIPTDNELKKVCHINPDGKITEIKDTSYQDGYLYFKFDAIGTFVLYTPKFIGDVNQDGVVNIEDVSLIQMFLINENIEICKENADFNKDGVINIEDVTAIQSWIAS